MENKSLVKLLALLFGLVSVYQLSFTFITNSVENNAAEYAERKISTDVPNYADKRAQEEARYLDSISDQTVLNIGIAKYTYKEAKEKELNKGLDLKGGINVILQISVKDILKGLAEKTKDPVFNNALLEADKASKNSDRDYVELFFTAFEKLDPQAKLASPSVFANKTLSDEVDINMANDQVKSIIRRKIDQSITSAFEVLRKRIDKFGVTQPNIQRIGSSGRILVELPGAKDVDRIKGLLQSTAELQFWHVYKNTEILPFIYAANQELKSILKPKKDAEASEKEKTETAAKKAPSSDIDTLLSQVDKIDSLQTAQGIASNEPLLGLIKSQAYSGSPVIALFSVKDTAKVDEYLKMPAIRALLTENIKYSKFLWGKPEKNSQLLELYAIKYNREGEPPLGGWSVVEAQQTYDIGNRPAVSMQMNGKGARIWEEMTSEAFTQKTSIAIVLDNLVYSAPGVSSGPISGGRSEITGSFSLNEAIDLANVLRAGKLPASAEIIQSEVVGPSLGQESIDNGFRSFILATLLVLIWMVAYYGGAGFSANVALSFNILLIFGISASLGAVLTLPGIAGIVLTIGMAVDANVIIFERVKEELARGKSQKAAIADGYSNALSSIIDGNLTTAITAIILLIFGSGPVKGFATMLIIGIVTSLFTGIYISRLVLDSQIKRKVQFKFVTFITKSFTKDRKIKFIEKRKIAYVCSSLFILSGIVSLFVNGLNQGVDFLGGRTYQVRFENPVNASQISAELVDAFGSAEAKTFGAPNQLKITTKYKIEEEGEGVDIEIQDKLYTALKKYLPENLSLDEFTHGTRNLGILSSIKVGPTIADDIKIGAFWAVLASLAGVFLYILFRFRKWQYSTGAVVAVFHDALVVLSAFSLFYSFMPFNMEIDQGFIAAILTVIGYSLNDTVVIFDRLREYSPKVVPQDMGLINKALNTTLGRTLNTALTTLVVLVAIFIFGGETLRGFMFAIIIGVVVGTYSTLYIAVPMVYDFRKRDKKGK